MSGGSKVRFHNANEAKSICCNNCLFAESTEIDGLIDCKLDGRSKDADMFCDKYEPLD